MQRAGQIDSLWFFGVFTCTVLTTAALSSSINDFCLPPLTTFSAAPPYDFVGIRSKCFWTTLVFAKIPFSSNIWKFCDKIIVWCGCFACTYRATSPQERPCANHCLPLMAFLTAPPGLAAGMVCHSIRGQCPIFLRMPLFCNLRTQCSQSVFRTNSFSHTIWAVANATDAGINVHLPLMTFRAFPPDSSSALQCHIMS